MSGVIATLTTRGAGTHSVNIGFLSSAGDNTYGYIFESSTGGISPNTFSSTTIRRVATTASGPSATADFFLMLNGASLGQGYFTSIKVFSTAGTFRTFLAASATYSTGGSTSTWSWGTGSDPVWTAIGSSVLTITA